MMKKFFNSATLKIWVLDVKVGQKNKKVVGFGKLLNSI
jgi:hypothetical protein